MQISVLAAQELFATFAFNAPVPAPVLMLAGGSDSLLTDGELELELEVEVLDDAAVAVADAVAAVVESGSACWATALFVLLFSNLARFSASSRSLASKYQTVMA